MSDLPSMPCHGFEAHAPKLDSNPTQSKRLGAQSPRPFMAHSGPDATSGGQRGQFDVKHGGIRGMK